MAFFVHFSERPKLSKLVKSLSRFEVDVRPTSQPNVTHILVRDKQSK